MIIEVEQLSPLTVEVSGNGTLVTEVIIAEVGPVGPPGPQGPAADASQFSIGGLADVTLTNPQSGDTLVFSAGKFRNKPSTDLVDGGNF